MFAKILIANRGEIALRIIRTCRELGIATAIVHSDADAASLPVEQADEAIGLPDPWCYLDPEAMVQAAQKVGAAAVHPGYGFLSENADFARMCRAAGLTFIGPSPEAMEHFGIKDRARGTAMELGIPVIPGSPGAVADEEAALAVAAEIGFPIMVKAVAGGGGRGMRIAEDAASLRRVLQGAASEAQAAFRSNALYLERYLAPARHVEIQVLVDSHGHGVYLGERDCSLQRRHQKLLEEAPAPGLDPSVRRQMGEAAVRLLQKTGYVNAGTVEFLLDPQGRFYFLEVNARIQVEHPVTECITGRDLIADQIRIAAGNRLDLAQADVVPRGWALECRINAEDPRRQFLPSPGLLKEYLPPGGYGLRVDSAARSGWRIPAQYDSLIAKVIAWGADREEAVQRMLRGLREMRVEGVPTTIPFHTAVLNHPEFRSGRVHTGLAASVTVEDAPPDPAPQRPLAAAEPLTERAGVASRQVAAIAGALAQVLDDGKPWRIQGVRPLDTQTPGMSRPGWWRMAGDMDLRMNRSLWGPGGRRRNPQWRTWT